MNLLKRLHKIWDLVDEKTEIPQAPTRGISPSKEPERTMATIIKLHPTDEVAEALKETPNEQS